MPRAGKLKFGSETAKALNDFGCFTCMATGPRKIHGSHLAVEIIILSFAKT